MTPNRYALAFIFLLTYDYEHSATLPTISNRPDNE